MAAQPTTLTVNDYLSEVRIFPPGSPDFAKIAASLGVDATLPTLGAGASLVVAIRNDSGGPVELRILYSLTRGGKSAPRDVEVGRSLAAGAVTMAAPREIKGALAGLLNAGKSGLSARTGSPTVQSLDDYQGATATVSIDSATLSDGKFIGADTQKFFDRLAAEDAAKRSFFSEVAGFQSAGLTPAQITETLTKRKVTADGARKGGDITSLNLAARTESGLCVVALMQLEHFGLSALMEWAEKENTTMAAKPLLHR